MDWVMLWKKGDGNTCLRVKAPLDVSGSCHEKFRCHVERSIARMATDWI